MIMLSSCGTVPPLVSECPKLPEIVIQKCPEALPKLNRGDNGSILSKATEWAKIYHLCKDRHNSIPDMLSQ
jgi:hypothetical protein